MKRIVLFVLAVLLVAACRGEAPPPAREGEIPPPPPPKRAAEISKAGAVVAAREAAAAAEEKEAEAVKVKEMLGAHKEKREILVGGCAQRCRAPLDGFRGFARALWKVPDPEEAQPVLRFVDTAELVDGELQRGREWADLFLEGRLVERREGIEAWRDAFVEAAGTLRDPADLQVALDQPLDMTRRSSEEIVIHFAPPATDKGAGGEIWHFTFGRRGLEWLLRSVERP
ncbi:MAG: hypothetical protein ABIK09_01905 [Pseudomonadota bacterium]